jgi:hypothetical protein
MLSKEADLALAASSTSTPVLPVGPSWGCADAAAGTSLEVSELLGNRRTRRRRMSLVSAAPALQPGPRVFWHDHHNATRLETSPENAVLAKSL